MRANAVLEDFTGSPISGYRTPAGDMTSDTIELLLELDFKWSSSTRGDDRPYFIERDGQPTSMVEIPAHWELDDFPYFMYSDDPPFPAGQGRISSYSSVADAWKAEFDAYYDEGLCFTVMFHPQTIGTPGRIGILDELLTHIKSRPDAWITTGSEVADWWRARDAANDQGHPAVVFERARKQSGARR
jgi:peptidoglycan/xylan/chitin deacetylase (PgdA/CDA1 family)